MSYSFDIYSGAVRTLQEDDYSHLIVGLKDVNELSSSVTMPLEKGVLLPEVATITYIMARSCKKS